jgi:hypothetical protein
MIQIRININVHVWDFGGVRAIVSMSEHLKRKIWKLKLSKLYLQYEKR